MSRRWVMVTDDPGRTIHEDGPSLWADEPEWECPHAGYHWMEEGPAVAAGYTYPVPVQSWVQVDNEAMTITGGPWQWDGRGDPPAEGTLMPETDAGMSGYTWP